MRSQKGQTLIEALLALTIVIVIITAVVISVIYSVSNSVKNKSETVALDFAQESMNILKDAKSADYSTFTTTYPSVGWKCFPQDADAPDTTDCTDNNIVDEDNNFKALRKVYIDPTGKGTDGVTQKCNANVYFVASVVYWTDGSCKAVSPNCHKIEIDSCFTNTSNLPAL